MPLEFEASEVSQGTEFTIKVRQKVEGEQQANETFRVNAGEGQRPLGTGGERNGIAKRDTEDVLDEAARDLDQAYRLARARLTEIMLDLDRRIDSAEEFGGEEIQPLRRQRDLAQEKLKSGTVPHYLDLGRYGSAFPDYASEPAFDGFTTMLNRSSALSKGLDSANPLFDHNILSPETGLPTRPEECHFITRSVASSVVDQALGVGSLSQEKFGLDPEGKQIGISVEVDGIGVIGDLDNGKPYFLDVDYSRPEIQKGLYDLEVVDYITGQIDRHAGNIFIDPVTGKVKGIDNDLAFPEVSREEMLGGQMVGAAKNKIVANLPRYVHEDTALKVESLRPKDLRRQLEETVSPKGEKLSGREIEGAVDRLRELQKHIRQLRKEGRVVSAFTQETYREAISDQENSFNREKANDRVLDNRRWDTVHVANAVSTCDKTSYVGSIHVADRVNQLGVAADQAEQLTPEAYRAAKNTRGIAARSPEHETYARLLQERRQALRQEAETRHQGERRKLEGKLETCDRKVEADKPGRMDRFKSAFRRGVHGGMESVMKDRQEVLFKLRQLDSKIDREVDRALDDRTKQGLFRNALEETRLQVPLTNPLGPQGPNVREALQQNRRPQQGEYVNFGEVLREAEQRKGQQTGVNQSGEYVDFGEVLKEAEQRKGQQTGVNQSGEYVDFGEVLKEAEQKRIGKPSVRDSLPKPSQDPNAKIGPGIGKRH